MSLSIESCPGPLALVRSDGRIREANSRFCALFAADESLAGRPLELIFPGQALPLARMAADGEVVRAQGRRLNGVPFTADCEAAALDGDGWTLAVRELRDQRLLEESLRYFDAAFERAPIGMALFDTDGCYVRVNDALARILGRTPAELLGRRDQELTHPDDRQSDVDAAWRILAGEIDVWQTEKRFLRPDGSVVWTIANLSFIRDTDGRPLAWLGQFQDITRRRAAEERLAASEERHRVISVQAPVGIFETDVAGGCVWANDRWCELAGMTPVEALGAGWAGALHPDDRQRVVARWHRATGAGEEFRLEYRLGRPDGRVRWVSGSAVPLRAPDGATTGYLGTISDITSRVEAQERLHEARQRVHHIFEHAPIGMGLVSVAAEDFGTCLQVNPALCEIFGRDEETLLRTSLLATTHPDDLAATLEQVARLRRGEVDTIQLSKRHLRPDGSTVWVETTAAFVRDTSGKPMYCVAMVQDVSERHRLERMKDEFMALASHELRTPLTSVLGYLQLVLDGTAGELNERQRRHLEVAERRALQLAALVADIHTLARADAGRMSLEAEPLDLAGLVAETLDNHRPVADQRSIDVALALPPGPIPLLGDRTRLAQVLDNLLSNALKFTPPGGRVTIRAERRGTIARVEVTDTGIGIADDEQAGLFERFFRTRAVTEQQIPGTGLGLAISRTIVEAHGGEIELESAEGVGTTLNVMLPLATAERDRR